MSDSRASPLWRFYNSSLPDFNRAEETVGSLAPQDSSPVEHLQVYIADPFRMIVWKTWVYQMEAAVGIIAILLFMGSAVIWRRWSERSLWIFRMQERRDGILFVPNAVTSFLVLEFVFGAIWIAYAIDQIRVAHGETSPIHLLAWLGLTWLPLIQGAWFAGWGTFFASPLQQQTGESIISAPPKEKIKLFPSPFTMITAPVLNLIMFIVPAVHAVAVAIFTIVSELEWKRAVKHWQELDSQLDILVKLARESSDPAGLGQVTDDLREKAISVWVLADEAMSTGERVWWVWFTSAAAFTVFYGITGGGLLLSLRREVSYLRRPISAPSLSINGGVDQSPDMHEAPQRADDVLKTSTLQTSFWPNIVAETPVKKKSTPKISNRNGGAARNAKIETMKRVFLLIGVQVICITIAAAGFSVLALVLALQVRRAVRYHYFRIIYQVCNLIAAWTACIFGGAIFFAITARTFEFLTDIVVAAAYNSPLGGSRSREREAEQGKGLGYPYENDTSNHSSNQKRSRGLASGKLSSKASSLLTPNGPPSTSKRDVQADDSIIVTEANNGDGWHPLGSSNPLHGSTAQELNSKRSSADVSMHRKVKWNRGSRFEVWKQDRSAWQDDSIILEDNQNLGERIGHSRGSSDDHGSSVDSRGIHRKVGRISSENGVLGSTRLNGVVGGLMPPPPRRTNSSHSSSRSQTHHQKVIEEGDEGNEDEIPLPPPRRASAKSRSSRNTHTASSQRSVTTSAHSHRSSGGNSVGLGVNRVIGEKEERGVLDDPLGVTTNHHIGHPSTVLQSLRSLDSCAHDNGDENRHVTAEEHQEDYQNHQKEESHLDEAMGRKNDGGHVAAGSSSGSRSQWSQRWAMSEEDLPVENPFEVRLNMSSDAISNPKMPNGTGTPRRTGTPNRSLTPHRS